MVITPNGLTGQLVITSLIPKEHGYAKVLKMVGNVMVMLKKPKNVVRLKSESRTTLLPKTCTLTSP